MTKEQRDLILDSIFRISADLYDKENPQKAALANELSHETEVRVLGLFERKDALPILAGLSANKDEDVILLKRYEDLLSSGTPLRKKLIGEMLLEDRTAIWKTQLAYHLVTSSLTKKQKEFIAETIPNISSILEGAESSKEDRIRNLEALESSIFRVFSKTEAYAVFMTIGIHRQHNVDSNIDRSPMTNLAPSRCACRVFCDLFEYSCGGNACSPTGSGCGVFYDQPCTNYCYYG